MRRRAVGLMLGASMLMPSALRGGNVNDLPLMPMPAQVEMRDGALVIDGGFRAAVCGARDAAMDRTEVHKQLTRFAARLEAETAIFMPLAAEWADSRDCSKAVLAIEFQKELPAPALGDDESYTLDITPSSARLKAATSTGVLRGLATFEQLVRADRSAFTVPALSIADRPRFPWRGLTLDVSRHWMPIEVVERNIEAMAQVKLNVFHWHLSDDQGFRVESRLFPKLQQLGSDGHYYTQAQIREVIAFAAERGIRVIPEFDIPGHTTSWVAGYPELASAPGPYSIERNWGVFAPVLDPSRESTFAFLDRFLGEMADLFPDPYFHIGGDEVLDTQWKANAAIQSFMRQHGLANSDALQAYFNRRVEAILAKHGKKMIGWDEILAPDLPKTALIQSWRGQESLADAARKGYRGLLSFGYYLDHMRPASFHYANDPLGGGAASLKPEEAARILGGEACMWTEYVSPETVDSRLWPRLAVIAERLWSPAAVNDPASMYARLEPVSRKLEFAGVRHLKAQDELLARIAGERPEPALKILATAVEAAGIHERYPSHKYNSLEPLNRLVDAAVAESEWARALTADAKAVASNPSDGAAAGRLRQAFTAWESTADLLEPLGAHSFLAAETLPVGKILSNLGATGKAALGFIERREAPPPGWVEEQLPLLDDAGKLHAEVRVAAGGVVRVLIDALGGASVPSGAATGAEARK
jgi:hexosaminidase